MVTGGANIMGNIWIRIALLYLLLAVLLGTVGLVTQWGPVLMLFAAVLLGGWLAGSLMGLIYLHFMEAADRIIGKFHFWLYQIGLLFFLTGLVLSFLPGVMPAVSMAVLAIGSSFLALGCLLFVMNLFLEMRWSGLRSS